MECFLLQDKKDNIYQLIIINENYCQQKTGYIAIAGCHRYSKIIC